MKTGFSTDFGKLFGPALIKAQAGGGGGGGWLVTETMKIRKSEIGSEFSLRLWGKGGGYGLFHSMLRYSGNTSPGSSGNTGPERPTIRLLKNGWQPSKKIGTG